MAKIKFSAIGITNMLGKAGGTIFSKNGSGSYFKNFVKPSFPNSAAQQAVNSLFSQAIALWQGLSSAAKEAWNTNAPNSPYTDGFGDQKVYSGYNLFLKRNLNLLNAGLATVTNWATAVFQQISSTDPLYDIGTEDAFTIDYNFPVSQGVDGAVVLECTPPVSSTYGNFDNQFRQVGAYPFASPTTGETIDAKADYEALFGVPLVDQVIHYRIKTVNEVGEAKAYFYGYVTVVESA